MASMKAFVVFLILALCSSIPRRLNAIPLQTPTIIEAIYQFGDSISDTGNLIRENPVGSHTAFARLPYGETYFHKPTGRCSNGLLMIDYIAENFNLPLLDAYLNKGGNFNHGVNFAVAGSTALTTSTLAAKNILSPVTNSSLSVQLGWFRSFLHSICSHPFEYQHKLANALFIIETGGNDFNYAFFQQKSLQDVQQMVDEVIQAITTTVKELISLGATKFVIPGNFPIGCLPIYLSAFQSNDTKMYDELHCLKDLNEFAVLQNNHLERAIKELQMHYPNVAIVYADYYNALRGLLTNAALLGFNKSEVQKACCGIGNNQYNFNMTSMCGYKGVPVCEYPDKSVSWDGVHMTQHAYQLMARWLIKKNILPGISTIV
ncbi:acetylajmalan esterase-like [Beta vulgaris subsp. vulgaris]|uniref:acetylajmalan esterase-like n=1 Tax=Beta vulgaris subsp. vulgaris TaxID=3555 RepID=UPI0020374518|nr:acetylajmalan esterase-like [Beta vulgaris subsp. vulgaris]